MSFQNVGVRGEASTRHETWRARTSADALAAKQKERNNTELSGLLYGKLRLVPSSSYETIGSDQPGSLEFSSCSESLSGSVASDAPAPSKAPPVTASKGPAGKVSPSRGIAGFSVNNRSKNRFQSTITRAPLQPKGWAEVGQSSQAQRPLENFRTSGVLPQEEGGTSAHKENSKFSELSTEIKHFSKMVSQLENLLERSAESAETQWRARILARSAQEADADIANKLYWYEKSLVDKGRKKEARTAQTACMSLHRDFRRIHKTLDEAIGEYERRQGADVSVLGAEPDSSILLQQEQEDFFERATREREEEIRNINQKMHKVNEIYQELAVLVEGQQEQIDVVQENVHNAKDTVEGGLRHIEYARDRLCAIGDGDTYEPPACGGGHDESNNPNSSARGHGNGGGQEKDYDRLYPSSLGESEIFHWSMPFQTFHKDIKSVQKDIFGLGNDIASFQLPETMQCGSLADLQCGKRRDASSVVGSTLYDDDESL